MGNAPCWLCNWSYTFIDLELDFSVLEIPSSLEELLMALQNLRNIGVVMFYGYRINVDLQEAKSG